jgi:hypothetical protein
VRAPAGFPADGPRYAGLGDAVTVPVGEWVGRGIIAAHERLYGDHSD